MVENSSEEGSGPLVPIPAVLRLRERYRGRRADYARDKIRRNAAVGIFKRAPMGQHVKGFLDPRRNHDEKLNLQAITADERKMNRVMGNRRPFKGSRLEQDLKRGRK